MAQTSDENLQAFVVWMQNKTDEDFARYAYRGKLSRKNIFEECGFSRSVLRQNPRVEEALEELERNLRVRGVLPEEIPIAPEAPILREPGQQRARLDAERLQRLEQENASLRAEVADLKGSLERFALLRDALSDSGRLPR